jgi:hypothetical protein
MTTNRRNFAGPARAAARKTDKLRRSAAIANGGYASYVEVGRRRCLIADHHEDR